MIEKLCLVYFYVIKNVLVTTQLEDALSFIFSHRSIEIYKCIIFFLSHKNPLLQQVN